MDFHLISLNLPAYKPNSNMAKVIALANQKGGCRASQGKYYSFALEGAGRGGAG
jgi:hypothetical protein